MLKMKKYKYNIRSIIAFFANIAFLGLYVYNKDKEPGFYIMVQFFRAQLVFNNASSKAYYLDAELL